MIKYYVKNVLKGKLEYNVTSLDPKHKDNLKKYGKKILDYENNINRNRIHYGENKTGDITNLKNILSMKKYFLNNSIRSFFSSSLASFNKTINFFLLSLNSLIFST